MAKSTSSNLTPLWVTKSSNLGAILNQIRSVDRRRLIKRLGMLDAITTRKIDEAIKISLGLVRI